jgi:hypothetical protein
VLQHLKPILNEPESIRKIVPILVDDAPTYDEAHLTDMIDGLTKVVHTFPPVYIEDVMQLAVEQLMET